jgi:hypothetical protein
MEKLYLFYQDCAYRGSICVIAKDEASARVSMSVQLNYEWLGPVEKHEIVDGLCLSNYGDM